MVLMRYCCTWVMHDAAHQPVLDPSGARHQVILEVPCQQPCAWNWFLSWSGLLHGLMVLHSSHRSLQKAGHGCIALTMRLVRSPAPAWGCDCCVVNWCRVPQEQADAPQYIHWSRAGLKSLL